MKRLQTRNLWLLISAVVIWVVVVVLLVSNSPGKGVSVTFQHFINHSNGRMALFLITNQWDRTVAFVAGPHCQVKVNGVWKDFEPGGGRSWGKAAGDLWEFHGTLQPGAWTTVAVIVPEGIGDWRAAVRNGPPPGKQDRLMFHLTANWKALRELKSLPGFKGTFHRAWPMTNFSHEFLRELDTSKPSSSSSFAEIPKPSR
jgi:hypothetical protein